MGNFMIHFFVLKGREYKATEKSVLSEVSASFQNGSLVGEFSRGKKTLRVHWPVLHH